jgi:hypothetical protein
MGWAEAEGNENDGYGYSGIEQEVV